MNKKLLAGLAAVGILAGGGGAAALATAGAPAAAASTVAAVAGTPGVAAYGPLGSLIATPIRFSPGSMANTLIGFLSM